MLAVRTLCTAKRCTPRSCKRWARSNKHGGAAFILHAAGEQGVEAAPVGSAAALDLGDRLAVFGQGLDVKPDPVGMAQGMGKPRRLDPSTVQADVKTHRAHTPVTANGTFSNQATRSASHSAANTANGPR